MQNENNYKYQVRITKDGNPLMQCVDKDAAYAHIATMQGKGVKTAYIMRFKKGEWIVDTKFPVG